MEDWVPDALLPKLYFRDANDVQWKRTARGVLVLDPGAAADGPVKQLPKAVMNPVTCRVSGDNESHFDEKGTPLFIALRRPRDSGPTA